MLTDMYYSKNAVIAGTFTSLVLCLAFIYLLSFCAQTLAYISLVATWIGIAFVTGLMGFYYKDSINQMNTFKATQG